MDKSNLYPQDKILSKTVLQIIPSYIRPNHLTILRFFLTPLVVWLIISNKIKLGAVIFLLAAFTDSLDGALARTRQQITDWGKIYDPLADKLLIGSVVFLLVSKFLSFYLTLAIIVLEIALITNGGWRKANGQIVQANIWGKLKMICQVVGIALIFLYSVFPFPAILAFSWTILVSALVLGTISLFTYSI